jgi:hypothetical protein
MSLSGENISAYMEARSDFDYAYKKGRESAFNLPIDVFDRNDPANLGRPLYFDLKIHIAAIEGLIRADELQMALKLCDMLPAWQRENYPKALQEIKNTIYQRLYDQCTYATDDDEANCTREFAAAQAHNGYMFPRLNFASELIKTLDKPWIYELGCSHGNLPVALIDQGHDFAYLGRGMNWRIVEKVKSWVGDKWAEKPNPGQPTIFVCFESLEHMLNEQDLEAGAKKVGVDFDHILISVPAGCLGHGLPDWNTRRLGHVRGYTKKDLFDIGERFFPGYEWQMTVSVSLVLYGKRVR